MMRLVIFGVVALLLGAGGSTGVLVLRAPAVPPGADSILAAHAKAAGEGHGAEAAPAGHAAAAVHDSAGAVPAAGEHAVAEAAPPAEHPVEAHAAAEQPRETVVRPAPADGVHEGLSARAPDAESYKQVGNILMNMKPAEAAKILAYLSDPQVEGLLRSMSPRNAATVLAQLPSERAAALSKRLLVPAAREEKP